MLNFVHSLIFICALAQLITSTQAINMNGNCTFCRADKLGVEYRYPHTVWQAINPSESNITSLRPFVETIATEYNTVLCWYTRSSRYAEIEKLVPQAIAEHNTKLFPKTSGLLNVWMLFTPNSPQGIRSQLLQFKTYVESVNQLFPNTITKIVFKPISVTSSGHHISPQSDINSKILFILRGYFPQKIYSLSVEYYDLINPAYLCDGDSIAYIAGKTNKDSKLIDWMHFMLKDIQTIQNAIQVMCNNTLGIDLIPYISDTDADGKVNYGEAVEARQLLLNLTSSKNMSVVLGSAFDSPAEDFPFKTSGWWQVIDKGNQGFEFQSKAVLAETENQTNFDDTLITRVDDNYEFDKKKICVYKVAPVMIPVDASPTIFLNKFYPKFGCIFSNIVTFSKPLFDTDSTSLSTNIGNYNKNKQNNPVELILAGDLENPSIRKMIKMHISAANNIYPNTVKQVVHMASGSLHELPRIGKRFEDFANISTVKFGLKISGITRCIAIKPYATKFLSQVEFLYFEHVPGITQTLGYSQDVRRVLAETLSLFSNCKQAWKDEVSFIDVGFITGFPDTFGSRKESYASLVYFWQEMDKWARKTNTKIVMHQAVDVPNTLTFSGKNHTDTADIGLHHMGWWKSVLTKDGWEFSEKREAVLQRKKELQPITVTTTATASWIWYVIPPISGVLLIGAVAITGYLFWKKRSKRTTMRYYKALEFDIEPSKILQASTFVPEMGTLIGTGNFGMVYKCYLPQFESDVAIKIPKEKVDTDSNAVKALMSEIKVMSQAGTHTNILSFLGVCVDDALFMVTEYCKNGPLICYLRAKVSSKEMPPSTYELFQYCFQITNGLQYLHGKGILHGDLSARNVLLTENFNCKICDFGLSRKINKYEKYHKTGEEPLPWRYMAIESLETLEFSTSSEIWSLGITFWEIFTLGKLPFAGMAWNVFFKKELRRGLRPEQPKLGGDALYALMLNCWEIEVAKRPKLEYILQKVSSLRGREYVIV